MWGCHPSHLHMVLYSIPLLFTLPDALWRKVTPLSPLGFFFTTQQVQHPVCLSTSSGNTQRLQKGPGSIRFTVLWRFVSCYYCVYEAKLDPLSVSVSSWILFALQASNQSNRSGKQTNLGRSLPGSCWLPQKQSLLRGAGGEPRLQKALWINYGSRPASGSAASLNQTSSCLKNGSKHINNAAVLLGDIVSTVERFAEKRAASTG